MLPAKESGMLDVIDNCKVLPIQMLLLRVKRIKSSQIVGQVCACTPDLQYCDLMKKDGTVLADIHERYLEEVSDPVESEFIQDNPNYIF